MCWIAVYLRLLSAIWAETHADILDKHLIMLLGRAGDSSVVSFSAFWVTVAALGATVLTAWGGYGKNSEAGLSMKRVGPMPALKVSPSMHQVDI